MIRPYESTDLDDLLDTWEASARIAHPFLSAEFMAQERVNIPELYLPNAETWVWREDERVRGFVALLGNEIGALFVHPELQRRGIGSALLDHARSLRGDLEVEVFKANALGRAFYNRSGFQLLHEKMHEPTGFELLRMRLAASTPDAVYPDADQA